LAIDFKFTEHTNEQNLKIKELEATISELKTIKLLLEKEIETFKNLGNSEVLS
jgi:uncharacterized protein YbaP (TraB family)